MDTINLITKLVDGAAKLTQEIGLLDISPLDRAVVLKHIRSFCLFVVHVANQTGHIRGEYTLPGAIYLFWPEFLNKISIPADERKVLSRLFGPFNDWDWDKGKIIINIKPEATPTPEALEEIAHYNSIDSPISAGLGEDLAKEALGVSFKDIKDDPVAQGYLRFYFAVMSSIRQKGGSVADTLHRFYIYTVDTCFKD